MGGNLFHCPKDWLYAGDSACLGLPAWAGYRGGDGGITTVERQRLKEPERENRELCRSNDILRQVSAYFAKAEFDRLWKNNATAG